jgi:hypothetical protein
MGWGGVVALSKVGKVVALSKVGKRSVFGAENSFNGHRYTGRLEWMNRDPPFFAMVIFAPQLLSVAEHNNEILGNFLAVRVWIVLLVG